MSGQRVLHSAAFSYFKMVKRVVFVWEAVRFQPLFYYILSRCIIFEVKSLSVFGAYIFALVC